ncbi:Ig-like domain-containing domain [Bacteroidota bacterium]
MNSFFHILISFLIVLLLATCAKIGNPAGGPRDKTPPRVEKSKPLNKSILFEGNAIEITFDEFIKTDAIGQEMVVSPPLEERPEIRLRGKTLVIEWEEELRDSTTYTFSFGESIKDLNESNILANFEFVFSTGNYLDSLGVIGTVLKAVDLEPMEEPVFLMLYENLSDSAPLLEIPDYVGKSNPTGTFLINNVRPATYRLFALQDLNRNFKYDVPEEFIGFLDTTLHLTPDIFTQISEETEKGDSVHSEMVDSIILSLQDSSDFSMNDSILIEEDDSLTLEDLAPWSIFVDIFVFQEDNDPQYLIDNTRKDRRKLSMYFNRRVLDTLILEPFDFEPLGDWSLFEEHIMNDTFVYWLTDSLVYNRDSLTVLATYHVTDSLQNLVPFHDTLKFNFREPPKKDARRKRSDDEPDEEEVEEISVSMNRKGGQDQDLYRSIIFEIQHPVSEVDTSRISLVRFEDSLEIPVPYRLYHDDVKLRRYFMKVDWEGLTEYKLDVFPYTFTDIYGLTHDTLSAKFRARDPEAYGRILLNLTGVVGQKVIQVLNNKGVPLRQKRVSSDGIVEFDYMEVGGYILKIIHDQNGNGKWDTGKYLEHIQPETVEFREGEILVRANFDMEISWELLVPEEPKP